MPQTKTLGGDRIGSGRKQKVFLHGYERSTHDMSYIWRSTMAAGTLVPFLVEVGLPGDTFDINLGCVVMTHPTIGPLFGSYKVQLDVFEAPIRLYQGLLHNNKLGIGLDMASVKLPLVELQVSDINQDSTDYDNQQVNPSCILSYLGIRGIGTLTGSGSENTRQFNAIPWLSYWDIYKNYYANKQEEIGAVIHRDLQAVGTTPSDAKLNSSTIPTAPTLGGLIATYGDQLILDFTGATPDLNHVLFNTSAGQLSYQQLVRNDIVIVASTSVTATYNSTLWGNGLIIQNWQMIDSTSIPTTAPEVTTFTLSNLDDMREYLLTNLGTSPVIINNAGSGGLEPYKFVTDWSGSLNPMLSTQEGLAVKTYQSDLFNNWLSTDWIDGAGGINDITAIDTSGGSFTIDTLNLSKKVYEMLNRIAVSGGSYDDWLDAVYDHDRITRAETPIYHGGLSKELVFQEVVSNSPGLNSDGQTQDLGTLAGRGAMAQKHKGGQITIKVNEPSYIIGIISLTPRIDYSQGNKWDTRLKTLDDLHKPQLDEIGFQELITEQMAWWTTTIDKATGAVTTKSAGKQPAWINYMTNVNQVRGNFAIQTNEMFMTLNRRYTPDTSNNGEITDLTTYIDPAKFNFIFAQTSLDAQNFWTQIAIDMTARRKMSAKVMPNL